MTQRSSGIVRASPTSPPEASEDAIRVLIVGWYPAADAVTGGRFVADQVAALAATGRVLPSVVAFENAALRGESALRDRQAAAIRDNRAAALRLVDAFTDAPAGGVPRVPTARITAAAGTTSTSGTDHRADNRVDALRALVAASGRSPWDLVHAHPGYPDGAAAGAAAAMLGAPLIVTEHARFLETRVGEPAIRVRYRDTLRSAARVVAVSRVLASQIVAIVPEVGNRIVVIPNAVDVEAFRPTAVPRVVGELLWVGNRVESKGIETLLRAFASLRRSRPETTLRLIGEPPPRDEDVRWVDLASRLGVGDAVRFEPAGDRTAIAAAMARADLFVHPSPFETFGVVVAEALAAGLPVVATDSGGVTEVLGDRPDELGAIVAPADPDALAAAIAAALDRRDSFDPHALRSHVVERFAAERVAARLVDLYRDVLADTPKPNTGRESALAAPRAGQAGAGDAVMPPVVIAGFSRIELDRARVSFPDWVWRETVVATTGEARVPSVRTHRAPSGTESRVAELLRWGHPGTASDAGRRALVTSLLLRLRSRIRRRGGGDAELLGRLRDTLRAAIEDATASGGRPVVVCLSGLDHLVAAPFVAAGAATAAPGGLRWLADVRADDQGRVDVASVGAAVDVANEA